jgi:hypothetical protein
MNHRRCASARSRHQQILDSNFEAHGGYGAALKANGTAFVSRTTLFADPTVAGANLVALETTGKVTVHDIAFEVNPPVAGDWTSIQVIRNRGGSVHVERSSFCSVAGTNPPISVLNESGSIRIGNSRVKGGFSNAGTMQCFGNYNEATLAPVTCP